MQILRAAEVGLLNKLLKNNPVVAILGPRQCGKTTLSRQFSSQYPSQATIFDLENPRDIQRIGEPLLALESIEGLVIIDEIQRAPDLFPVLRVLSDRSVKTKYLILGSASRDLIRQSSESLAGRISYLEIGGFNLNLVGYGRTEKLWIRGTFPRSFLASSEAASYQWRQDFIATFLERDIPQLGFSIPAKSLGRFWRMLAYYHGQIFSASEIGKSLGVSDHTAQRYLDLLSGTFMVRQLRPWYYNTKKRIIKRPKIYFRDSGVLHALLSLEEKKDVLSHPKLGASWEGFALEEAIKALQIKEDEAFFWGVHSAAELDLVFEKKGKLYGIEMKYAQAPTLTPSMRSGLRELSLKHLWVIYPGKEEYPLGRNVTVVPLSSLEKIKIS
ncbi:MAG: ATP-binding protein [Candidatus Omnitrophota bacterium]|nr:ATP-binding protein [Candidatus Omnitrophota bacterium]MBU1928276.1 ATP-binding protein [Candidatus Omnitrophota bacterium]MBU2034860.1 ATP-binding protein [Candidatus Omnitrophota bacterium]MBU2257533.1 ATP-binding protein [Candidatus Omnitrophota bacterium]